MLVMEESSTPPVLFSRKLQNSVILEKAFLLLLSLIVKRSFASDKRKSFAEILSSRTNLKLDNVPGTLR